MRYRTERTGRSRSRRSASSGTRYGMRAALILYLARTSRFAIADSLKRKDRATSSTLRPPSSRRVKATWCSVRSAGWQQVKISRSRSSPTDPFLPLSAPSDVRANTPSCSWSSRPRAERRKSSIARFRAVVTIHPAGLGGMPSFRHRSLATTNASCTASSASVMSPKRRISVATARPYASRNTRSTVAASSRAATTGVTPGRGRSLGRGGPRSDGQSRPRLSR